MDALRPGLSCGRELGGGPAEAIRLAISPTPPQTLAIITESDSPIAIAPGGRHQVFVGRTSAHGAVQLIVKSMDQVQTVPLAEHGKGAETHSSPPTVNGSRIGPQHPS